MVTGVSDFYLSKLFKEFFPESCEMVIYSPKIINFHGILDLTLYILSFKKNFSFSVICIVYLHLKSYQESYQKDFLLLKYQIIL